MLNISIIIYLNISISTGKIQTFAKKTDLQILLYFPRMLGQKHARGTKSKILSTWRET